LRERTAVQVVSSLSSGEYRMVVVLAVDALEFDKTEEFNCVKIKQAIYGKTDISEFKEPRTIVLWSSFMTGENKEEEVLEKGNKDMWNIKIPISETFFANFQTPRVIDLPAFSYDLAQHQKERELLKQFFEDDDQQKKKTIQSVYNQIALKHHKKIKSEFLKSLEQDFDFVLGYFSAIDVVGHLNFGNKILMRMLYDDIENLVEEIKQIRNEHLLILSDHGMKAIGIFGEHSNYGYWSFDSKCSLENPKITDFANFLTSI